LEKKHINKRKNPDDEFWANDSRDDWTKLNESVGEKLDPGEVFEIQDRAITFNVDDVLKTKEEKYKQQASEFKDGFGNTAQYLKFVNAHLANKTDHIEKILAEKEKFAKEIADLNPELATKEQLDNKNYNKLKSYDIRRVLEHLEEEKDVLKEKIEYFGSKTVQANDDLENKNKQVNDIKSELSHLEMMENSVKSKIKKEDDGISAIQKELKSIASKDESEKIFGAINSLVVLLNSKNQSTLNELSLVKSEFNKMKQEYEKVMKGIGKKSN